MNQQGHKIGLNTFILKIIAIISMLIDHIGAVFFPEVAVLRMIGRMAFPIFAYLLVEGFCYTHDVKKYMMRLGIFALISEVPFDLAFYGTSFTDVHQNVFFTLFIGLVTLYCYWKVSGTVSKSAVLIAGMLIAEFLCTDYSSMGIAIIIFFYLFREQVFVKLIIVALINIFLMGGIQLYAVFGLVPVALHNREQGPKIKWLFYGFYPAHLLVLGLINIIL